MDGFVIRQARSAKCKSTAVGEDGDVATSSNSIETETDTSAIEETDHFMIPSHRLERDEYIR